MDSTASPVSGETYWERATSPIASLIFVLPLLAVYEGGVLLLGGEAMRNGVDVWLREALEQIAFGQYTLRPAATCGRLLASPHASRCMWSVSGRLLAAMTLEAALLAALLFAGALALARWLPAEHPELHAPSRTTSAESAAPPAFNSPARAKVARMIAYCGAGLYEELLFRLMLLPAAALVLHTVWGSRQGSLLAAAVVSSALFALAHHLPGGEPWIWQRAVFRWSAGMVFSALFLLRGYGVAAVSHAGYDLLVACAEP